MNYSPVQSNISILSVAIGIKCSPAPMGVLIHTDHTGLLTITACLTSKSRKSLQPKTNINLNAKHALTVREQKYSLGRESLGFCFQRND